MITGVVLAGGESKRMGTNKALLKIDGKPFVQHISEILQSVCGDVCIISDDEDEYRFLNIPVYPDVYKNSGPLAGIHSAFKHTRSEFILVASCDIPFITAQIIREIAMHMNGEDAVVPVVHEAVHPLCAVYRRSAYPCIESSLREGKYTMIEFLSKIRTRFITLPIEKVDGNYSPLYNINTAEDYTSFLKFNKVLRADLPLLRK